MTARIILVLSLLLATAIAFADGGASPAARPAFLAGALALVAASMLCRGPLVPVGRSARLTLGGLAGFALLTAASGWWSPSPGGWQAATELAVAYFGLTYAAARAVAAEPGAVRMIVPGVLAGTTVVIGYGLVARAEPDLIAAKISALAGGRLYTPVGYWNAMGLIGAFGLVAAAGLVAGKSASVRLQQAALAAAPVLGAGIALSYSRTAIAAAAAGIPVALLIDGQRSTAIRSVAVALAAGAGAATTIPFPDVRHGDVTAGGGWLWLVVLAATAAALALVLAPRLLNAGDDGAHVPAGFRRWLIAGLVLVCVTPFVAALTTRHDAGERSFGANAGRLTETASNRAQYWKVALHSFSDRPTAGYGAGSFAGLWLERRSIDEKVVNAHSLWLEAAAELGLAGLLMFGVFAAGVVSGMGRSDALDAAPLSGLAVAWMLGASFDWHWQIPAVTAPALIAVAGLVSSQRPGPAPTSVD